MSWSSSTCFAQQQIVFVSGVDETIQRATSYSSCSSRYPGAGTSFFEPRSVARPMFAVDDPKQETEKGGSICKPKDSKAVRQNADRGETSTLTSLRESTGGVEHSAEAPNAVIVNFLLNRFQFKVSAGSSRQRPACIASWPLAHGSIGGGVPILRFFSQLWPTLRFHSVI